MTRTLKIAVASHFFPSSSQPNRGRPVYEIAKALARIADVRVFCIDSAYPRYKLLQPRSFTYRDSETSHGMPGVNVEYLQYTALPVITRPLNGYNCGRALLGRLRKFRPDLVIGYNVYPEGFGAVAAARDLGIPVVIGALGSDILRIPGYVVEQLVSRTLKRASFVVTVSNALRERAIRFGIPPEKCRTIHNGCDFDIFRPASRTAARLELSIDPEAEVVVFVGRLVAIKGLREFMEAAAILKASRPHLRIVCIGEGPMGPELLRRASQPDLQGLVRFVGSANSREIARWLAASNVLCLPSHSEGCPNVVIEAISCGRPVVASNVGGIPELLNASCGMLVPPENAQELAQTLYHALDRPWDEKEIANSSRRSWDEVARETYQACCAAVRDSGLVGEAI